MGVWGQGKLYGLERMLGRTAAGRWAMGAGSSLAERGAGLWRNIGWGSGPLGTLSRMGGTAVGSMARSSLIGAALGLPMEYLMNGVNWRSTVAGLGGAFGSSVGFMGGGALGLLTTAGTTSAPLAFAGGVGGGIAGREGALALFDWLASRRDMDPSVTKAPELKPEFNIDVRIDQFGRPTTTVDGPGLMGLVVNPRLGPSWAPAGGL